MAVRVPVPRRYWPRNGEDLQSLSERMGGPFTLVFGPEESVLNGTSRRKIVAINVTLDTHREPPMPQAPTESLALDPRLQGFIKELARRTAKAWVAELRRDEAAQYESKAVPYKGSNK